MGHCNRILTDRYAHLRPDLYRDEDYRVLAVDLQAGCGKVLPMRQTPEKGANGYDMATPAIGSPDRATVTG